MLSQNVSFSNQILNSSTKLSAKSIQDIEQRFAKLEVVQNIKGKNDEYEFRPFFDEALDIKQEYGSAATAYFLNTIADKNKQKTALHFEAEGGLMDPILRFWLVKLMLQEGADYRKIDLMGNTALHLVMSSFEFMISSAKSDEDRIPGGAKTQMAIAACLLAYGADPTIPNNAGQTPWNCLQQKLNKLNPDTINKVGDIYNLKALSSAYCEQISDGIRLKSHQSSLDFDRHEKMFNNYSEVVGLENITKWEGKISAITLPQANSGCSIQ